MSEENKKRLAVLEAKELKKKASAKRYFARRNFKLDICIKFFEKNASNAEKSQLKGQLASI